MQNEYSTYKFWIIYCSFFIAIILQTILFFPKTWNIHPSWTMILLIYWITISPYQVNIGTGFILGLILDVILGSILGIHALSLSIIVYLIIRKIYFFKYFSTWIQSFFIIFFSLINQMIILLATFLIIKITYSPKILWNCILDGSMWPIMNLLMRKIFKIHTNI